MDPAAPDLAGRYGFLRKPRFLRFRVDGGFRGFSELSVRADEFTAPPDGVTRVYVVENEITYLAFPGPGEGDGDLRRWVRRLRARAARLAGRARRRVLG